MAHYPNTPFIMNHIYNVVIAWRFGMTLYELTQWCHCDRETLVDCLLTVLSWEEYREICRQHMARPGNSGVFPKGYAPWNKDSHEAPRCGYQKGEIRGHAARVYVPVGTITTRKDYRPQKSIGRRRTRFLERRWIKVNDELCSRSNWMPYAKYVYEKEHGPVPKGYRVVHLDGNHLNDELSNLGIMRQADLLKVMPELHPGFEEKRRRGAARAAKRVGTDYPRLQKHYRAGPPELKDRQNKEWDEAA